MTINYRVLTEDNEIATVAASLVDKAPPKKTGSALVREGDLEGIPTLTIDLGGTLFVITE